ncbi:MAG: sensor histidine kinase [Granulosicoccus sp.]
MKIVTQLRITLLMILLLGLFSAALSVWNLQSSRSHMAQINLSHSIYENYLMLESHTYQLFKQYGDAIIIGDANQRAGKQALIELIDSDTQALTHLIGQKISLVGEQAESKLDALAIIDSTVKQLIVRLDQFSPTGTGELVADWGRLSLLLNQEIDEGFRGMIQAALNEENQDVQQIVDGIESAMLRQHLFAGLFAFATFMAVLAAVIMLDRRVTRPINTLLSGVRKFGEGQLEHRVNIQGRDELAEIGSSFDIMAQRVASKNQSLTSEKETLREAVDDRTRQLTVMLDDVRQSEEGRKRMIADVSHELRTPLTIIRGESDLALRGEEKTAEVYKDALRRVREAAGHTARLVDDLLFVARTEAGEVQLNVKDMDLYQVVEEARDTFGHDVPIVRGPHKPILHGDAGRIRQALLVLLENARHHGGEEIQIRLAATENGYSVAVEDSGPGMSDVEKGQAFERFFRGSNAAERYEAGAGLGLPVALSIAQAHGGTIILEDRQQGGLVATLNLPVEHYASRAV